MKIKTHSHSRPFVGNIPSAIGKQSGRPAQLSGRLASYGNPLMKASIGYKSPTVKMSGREKKKVASPALFQNVQRQSSVMGGNQGGFSKGTVPGVRNSFRNTTKGGARTASKLAGLWSLRPSNVKMK